MAVKHIGIAAIIFAAFLTNCLALEEAEVKDIYMQAATCPHRFHMGCMLDVLEKSCTGIQAIQSCTEKGKCNDIGELTRIIGALQPDNFEALNKCCCHKAFPEGYEDCKDPNPVCKKSIANHFSDDDLQKHLKSLKSCRKTKKKEACKEALAAAKWVMEAVQKARGELWQVEGCKILASPEPISTCGWDVKPEPRAVGRADLYCDTIIWQFKEMGASDPFMAQCKDAPKMPVQKEDPGPDSGDMADEGAEGEEYGDEEPNEGDEEEMEEREEEGEEPLDGKETNDEESPNEKEEEPEEVEDGSEGGDGKENDSMEEDGKEGKEEQMDGSEKQSSNKDEL